MRTVHFKTEFEMEMTTELPGGTVSNRAVIGTALRLDATSTDEARTTFQLSERWEGEVAREVAVVVDYKNYEEAADRILEWARMCEFRMTCASRIVNLILFDAELKD